MSSSSKKIPEKYTVQERALSNLIIKVSEGDERSLEELYDKTSSIVFGLILKILSDRQEAEEVLGDIYMQIWERSSTYDPELSKPVSWILMITRSRSIDKIRAGSKRKALSDPINDAIAGHGNNPETNSIIDEKRKIIRNALSELDDNQKKAIELAYFFGMSQSEIAEEMNKPLGTVKSWIRFGMKKLRDKLTKT